MVLFSISGNCTPATCPTAFNKDRSFCCTLGEQSVGCCTGGYGYDELPSPTAWNLGNFICYANKRYNSFTHVVKLPKLSAAPNFWSFALTTRFMSHEQTRDTLILNQLFVKFKRVVKEFKIFKLSTKSWCLLGLKSWKAQLLDISWKCIDQWTICYSSSQSCLPCTTMTRCSISVSSSLSVPVPVCW